MSRILPSLFGVLALSVFAPGLANAQAVVPADHPGFVLAEAIAERGCVLHQDDVNAVLDALELEAPQFPQMAVPLMRDGFLAPGEAGTLALSNWGVCAGEFIPPEADDDLDDTAEESEAAITVPETE